MTSRRILIAGIGNIFLGDDAFGVEVVQRLAVRPLPEGIVVRDFGIRGLDLVYALQEGYDAVILVDAIQRGGRPGNLIVLEPCLSDDLNARPPSLEPHHLDPLQVLRLAAAMGGKLPVLRLVGCEPETLELRECEAGQLSDPVQRSLEPAIALILQLIDDLRKH